MGDMDGDGMPPPSSDMGPPPPGMEGMDEMHTHMDDVRHHHGPGPEGDMPPPPEGDRAILMCHHHPPDDTGDDVV